MLTLTLVEKTADTFDMLQVCDTFTSDIGGTLRIGTEVTSQSKVKDGKFWLSPVKMSPARQILLNVGD